jgi:hypothetical protein
MFILGGFLFYKLILPPLGSQPVELTLTDLETGTFSHSSMTANLVTGEFLGDTGWEYANEGWFFGIGASTDYYGVIAIGDRAILIRQSARFDENTPDTLTIRGIVVPNTSNERRIIEDVVDYTVLTTDDFLPLRVDEIRDPYKFPYNFEVFIVLACLVIALYGVSRFIWVTILRRG